MAKEYGKLGVTGIINQSVQGSCPRESGINTGAATSGDRSQRAASFVDPKRGTAMIDVRRAMPRPGWCQPVSVT